MVQRVKNQVKPRHDRKPQSRADTVSLLSLFALVYRTCATFLEDKTTPEEFFPYTSEFVHKRLRNSLHRSIFRYVLRRLRTMDFEQVKRECAEIPTKIAEKNKDVWDLIVQYEVNHLTH